MTTDAVLSNRLIGPLIICGMHRSGTSLTASLFGGAGVHLGNQLLGADGDNQLGHFEDVDILLFHQAALRALGFDDEGYVTRPLPPLADRFAAEAERIIAARTAAVQLWGWKEPRTTLFLDFWDRLLPDSRYAFVFRNPWDVADSLFRRGDAAFVVDPRLAIDVWVAYNRRIIEFVDRHPTRCVVFEISQIIAEPKCVFDMVRSRLGVRIGTPPDHFRNDLFGRASNRHGEAIVRALVPEAIDLYRRMQQLAGGQADETDAAGTDATSLAAYAVEEWARASRAVLRKRKLTEEIAAMTAREQDVSAALTAAVAERDAATQRLAAVIEERDRSISHVAEAVSETRRLEAECQRLGTCVEQLSRQLAEARGTGPWNSLTNWAGRLLAMLRPPARPAGQSPRRGRRTAA